MLGRGSIFFIVVPLGEKWKICRNLQYSGKGTRKNKCGKFHTRV